ncbi:hypothetical protein Ae201684_011006 [Aphanomyces euteiches]|uniref:DUF4460 domain-containing protein n=1 Tax=Aphanomyces euteiches TaxID=100861 RepID=A0A6G0WVW7_9STRA|nr:hypothetical protein Ae201684_011006 [Aphanomyces euteiches]KAH9145679.1 hypothetical protein AeRB84_010390 [Aphanomyces euteiches]
MFGRSIARSSVSAILGRTRSYAKLATMKPVNIKLVMSTLLLSVHPDVMQVDKRTAREVPQEIRDQNEESLKTLNAFLDVAAAGCNGDLTQDDLTSREFRLEFAIPTPRKIQRKIKPSDTKYVRVNNEFFTRISRRVNISNELLDASQKALSQAGATDLAAVHWRKFTNSVLIDLYDQADIPVVSTHPNGELIPWDEAKIQEAEAEKIFTSNVQFEKKFKSMLTHERNIVFKLTTGFEEDVKKHKVLLDLLGRTHTDSLPTEDRSNAFNWIGEQLLRNFMELRLANPIWNRVVIILTDEEETLDVLEDVRSIAFVVGFTHDFDRIVDFMHEHVTKLEAELDATSEDAAKGRRSRKGIRPSPKRLY